MKDQTNEELKKIIDWNIDKAIKELEEIRLCNSEFMFESTITRHLETVKEAKRELERRKK